MSHGRLSRVHLTQKTVSAGENKPGGRRTEPDWSVRASWVSMAPPPASFLLRSHEQAPVARRPASHCGGGHESSRPFTSTWVPSCFMRFQRPFISQTMAEILMTRGAGAGSGCLQCLFANNDDDNNILASNVDQVPVTHH